MARDPELVVPPPSAYDRIMGRLTVLCFGESPMLRRVGMANMPMAWKPWYWFAGGTANLVFRSVLRWERVGLDRIPRDQGAILAVNHLSSADPAMLASAIYPRWPKYMAKIELFQKKPLIGFLFALSGAFPVKRFDADIGALREAERLLERGELVGMFPEGHRSDTGAMIESHPGTALLALRSGAPVVPIGITGSERMRGGWRALLRRPRVRVVVGDPFMLPKPDRINREVVAAANERLMWEIAARLPANYRGVYRARFADLPETATLNGPPPGRAAEAGR